MKRQSHLNIPQPEARKKVDEWEAVPRPDNVIAEHEICLRADSPDGARVDLSLFERKV